MRTWNVYGIYMPSEPHFLKQCVKKSGHAIRPIFSFVVDGPPKFTYQGYHLARSIIEHCCDSPSQVHVQFTPEVDRDSLRIFLELGCTIHEIERFGDGRYCNKLSQLPNLQDFECDTVVLLDTDMIVLDDLRPHLSNTVFMAKIVDLANPPIAVLDELGVLAGITAMPPVVAVDACEEQTYCGNCNGGFYSVPKALCDRVEAEWRRWATWLLDHMDPLKRVGKESHVDQVAMWLALHLGGIPFAVAPSNLNYYLHFEGKHHYFDPGMPISLLHYHDSSINVVGNIEVSHRLSEPERIAVERANNQIASGFNSLVFWNFRYCNFPQRGSGVGPRGENLLYKRNLLVEQGVENAGSVLDVGCGDLEVIRPLAIKNYLGVDTSPSAMEIARGHRPEWKFQHIRMISDLDTALPCEMVLCFEVLIHQPTEYEYQKVIAFLSASTMRTLLVSGYNAYDAARESNAMLHFYEPLELSLNKSGKFKVIKAIGAHSDVIVFRCDVSSDVRRSSK